MEWKTEKTLREHQAHAGRSKTDKKIRAVTENLKKAWAKRTSDSPSKSALYQRERRKRLKEKSQ